MSLILSMRYSVILPSTKYASGREITLSTYAGLIWRKKFPPNTEGKDAKTESRKEHNGDATRLFSSYNVQVLVLRDHDVLNSMLLVLLKIEFYVYCAELTGED